MMLLAIATLRRRIALAICPELAPLRETVPVFRSVRTGQQPYGWPETKSTTPAEHIAVFRRARGMSQRGFAEQMNKAALIELAQTYSAHKGLTLATVATYATNDGKFFKNLKENAGCTLARAERVVSWFSLNWPEDLEWPTSIPRPPKPKKEAA